MHSIRLLIFHSPQLKIPVPDISSFSWLKHLNILSIPQWRWGGVDAGEMGASPLIATIILIAITVGAGLVMHNLFFGTAGTLSAQLSI